MSYLLAFPTACAEFAKAEETVTIALHTRESRICRAHQSGQPGGDCSNWSRRARRFRRGSIEAPVPTLSFRLSGRESFCTEAIVQSPPKLLSEPRYQLTVVP